MRAPQFERRTEPRAGERVLVSRPVFRRLRVLAMDPGSPVRFETAVLNEMTLPIPWEHLAPGPAGEYVAVVDQDEAGAWQHEPVDLDRPLLLAQDGLAPSSGNPQFHQQMVYAVAMRTIRDFERALGRAIHWAQPADAAAPYLRQLRFYPHYMEDANVYYDQAKGVLFGWFRRKAAAPRSGELVFTCLSPDTIAHALSHALLAGMGFELDGAGPDAGAFQEGFSDLVALLQRFWPSEALRDQIGAVQGHIQQSPSLGAIGLQFGQALVAEGAAMAAGIRNAFGTMLPDGTWRPRQPDPSAYAAAKEPHERGGVLLCAIAEAFRKLYEWRVADLRRIASKGTGVLPVGELHPDLLDRFVREAVATAQQLLDLCIRALDYLPPVEVTFGDYLRALVTADYDVNPLDERRHRSALREAFAGYGIFPGGVATLSDEALLWPRPGKSPGEVDALATVAAFFQELSRKQTYWSLPRDREALWRLLRTTADELRGRLRAVGKGRLGAVDLAKPFDIRLMPMDRTRGSGQLSIWWVVRVVGRARPPRASGGKRTPLLTGCTLIVDAATGVVRTQVGEGPAGRNRPAPSLGAPRLTAPAEQRLRVFAFDPSVGAQLETARINEVVLRVPWERDGEGADVLGHGPVGEYLAVVDRDPASGCFYDPVDLRDPSLLADCGLAPSESNPQFHQQMVYAVAMRTIRTFELALGRLALWAPRRIVSAEGQLSEAYVRRLRIYPHALREANAYYSPEKQALLFGYFPAPRAGDVPGGGGRTEAARLTVFTCLSQDVVAHEVTHALLDGMHRRFREPSNPDVFAFHEGFADLVALFQHFSLPDVLRHQIASTRGDLASQNRLGELAQQFGQAIGNRGALRSAIGETDPDTGEWRALVPDPNAYREKREPHDLGAILVAAVFDAFLTIYKARIADLLRIASEGTGVLPAGQLHPDLVNRLAAEAARTARHVLEMCVRALDYCPPVDLTFGDYLRAIVTADFDFDPVDAEHRRVAFAEAFRQRGIVPEDVRTLSVDGLLWRPTSAAPDEDEDVVLGIVKSWVTDISAWDIARDRRVLFDLMPARRAALHAHLARQLDGGSTAIGGLLPDIPFEVHSVRPSIRSDWEGTPRFQWVIELTQRVPQFLEHPDRPGASPDYYLRGGCTLVVDAETGKVRYGIKKRLDDTRRDRQRRYLVDEGNRNLAATYFGPVGLEHGEPFAMLHRR